MSLAEIFDDIDGLFLLFLQFSALEQHFFGLEEGGEGT